MTSEADLKDIQAALGEWRDGRAAGDGAAALWRQRIKSGQPAVDPAEFPAPLAADALVHLAARLENLAITPAAASAGIAAYLGTGACGGLPSLSQAKADMYAHLACQAALAAVAREVGRLVALDAWGGETCPVCGDEAAFGFLDTDGKRSLVCGSCAAAWTFRRLGCAVCGQDDPERMEYLETEEFPGWQVAACGACRGYLKTADLRVLKTAPDWQTAIIATLPLDYAARKWLGAEAES